MPAASPARNLADLVSAAAHAAGAKTALVSGSQRLSWAELDERVRRTAAALADLGAAPGDRLALLAGNTPAFVTTYFGALRAGLVVVPVNTQYTADEVGHQLRDSGTRWAVCDPALVGVVEDGAVAGLELLVTGPDSPPAGARSLDKLVDAAGTEAPVRGGAEDLALLVYTSGTSGRPKGAMLSHRALLANIDQISQVEPPLIGGDDVLLLVLPLFHIYGLNAGLGLLARHAATGVLVERFDPAATLQLLAAERVTTVVGAPPMYVAWTSMPGARAAFATVRMPISGAAPLPVAVWERVLEATGRRVYEGYGLTEAAPVVTTTRVGDTAKPGSIGRPLPGVALRLLDEAGREVEEDDPGEIVIRGSNLFSGYWPDGADGPDADGWFHTGDVAVADAEGDLHLVDRRHELIIVSGFNVYPREVEDVLAAHPAVAEAAVIGVPDDYTGETVKALVVPQDGSTVDTEALREFAATRLARFKLPTVVTVVGSLPHSATGKVAKGQLREAEDASPG